MNKEVMDEFKKNDMQELSLDELDIVAGGAKVAPDDFTLNGYTARKFGALLDGIYKNFCREVAIDVADQNYPTVGKYTWAKYIDEGGCYFACDMIWGKAYVGGF